MSDLARAVQKMLSPLVWRVRSMVSRAVLQLVDDTKTLQTLQVSMQADDLRDTVERFQQFGFTSMPQVGAEAIVVLVGGNGDHPVVLAVDDRRYRPKALLQEGEVALYTLIGVRVHCKADGSVELGTTPTDFVALAQNTETRLAALEAFAASHTHLATGIIDSVSGPCTGSTMPAVGAPTSSGPVAATQVKAI